MPCTVPLCLSINPHDNTAVALISRATLLHSQTPDTYLQQPTFDAVVAKLNHTCHAHNLRVYQGNQASDSKWLLPSMRGTDI